VRRRVLLTLIAVAAVLDDWELPGRPPTTIEPATDRDCSAPRPLLVR